MSGIRHGMRLDEMIWMSSADFKALPDQTLCRHCEKNTRKLRNVGHIYVLRQEFEESKTQTERRFFKINEWVLNTENCIHDRKYQMRLQS
jgi:hypothetical protein